MVLKVMQVLITLKFQVPLTLNYYTESSIKNKLKIFWNKLRGFKFVTKLVLEFKKNKK